jgi:hypothetical protein
MPRVLTGDLRVSVTNLFDEESAPHL